MANLKEIRTRIESVESTQQITTAMRMVSASKLRKAELAFSAIQPYADQMLNIGSEAHACYEQKLKSSLIQTEERFEEAPEKILLFVLASNRGLCGSFNSNVTKFVNELIKKEYKDHLKEGRLHLMTAGRRSGDFLAKQKLPVVASYDELVDKVDYKRISGLSDQLLKEFQNKTYDRVILVYNKFKTVLTQEVTVQQFLPVLPPSSKDEHQTQLSEYIFEPGMETVLLSVYPRVKSIQLYRTFLESLASEEGARMTAMQQASDNAAVLLKDLKIKYNKARQAAITNELIEIISGSEALK